MRKLGIAVFSIFFAISAAIMLLILVSNDDSRIDPEYVVHEFEGEIEKREFKLDQFSTLCFIYDVDPLDANGTKKTKMLGSAPVLNIVNSEDYRVEITANSDMYDALSLEVYEDWTPESSALFIAFKDEYYVPVYEYDTSYDYDLGMYIGFDQFEVTVYAPVNTLLVDGAVVLDYEAPKCDKMRVEFSYEGTKADIHDIDALNLKLVCSGDSDIKLSGKVEGEADISIWHQSKIDADELTAGSTDFYVSSSMLYGFSYIKYGATYHLQPYNNIFQMVVVAIVYLSPILWLGCLCVCIFHDKIRK